MQHTAPDSLAQFMRSPEQMGEGVTMGAYTVKRGMMPGRVWIQHETGEGADIDAAKVEAVIAELFEREF